MQQNADQDALGAAGFTESLDALSNPVRVQILQQLRAPKILKDVKVRVPDQEIQGTVRERLLTRQAVKAHLEKLMQAGVVSGRETKRGNALTMEYVLNQSALFRLAEEFRELAGLRPVEPVEDQTIQGSDPLDKVKIRGPCLLIVKGLDEGRVFPLEVPAGDEMAWVIGRRRGLDVSLDYDPYVSSENSRLLRQDGAWFLEDLASSRNGTTRNFELIPKGRQVPLEHRDLIGVGRSVLSFQS